MQSGDLAAIYRESSPGFKAATSETQLVSIIQEINQENGSLKKAEEVAYQTGVDSRIGRTYVLLFKLEYERREIKERMTLTRSDGGQMQVWKIEWIP
jgi:hypothetical protein